VLASATPCPEDFTLLAETVTSLVARSSSIAIARVHAARDIPDDRWEGDNVLFDVEVLGDLLSSESPRRQTLAGVRATPTEVAEQLAAVNRHNNLQKLGYRMFGGATKLYRVKATGKCEYVPSLAVGQRYLIFLPRPYSPKSFEPILDPASDGFYHSIVQEYAIQEVLRRGDY
jgi:hypothetical protein